ncbi:nitroreductase family protein [Campylobacter lanienae]|uniref:NAD(P)H-dependent oxidoreductase n=2 Tax=Campylobacter TaxID=194 RepID=A0ABY3G8T2_9BACT|nr:nitroreductase family protein [Campylobacter lanienae]MCI7364625.1 nitroreductase family protein [Campylobacter lanienae]TWO13851.1 NAD(P)H-dependent oxidoreductase [Campylobacter lanienae]TWO28882.1 NAD(P)H-dependent oxidoreductase [Campylobacter lanienae]
MKKIMQERFSCREFNSKKIDNSIIDEILDLSRLSPSSCGLEPWKFMVVSKENDLKELGQICNNQAQVSGCSHAIIIIARNDLKSGCDFIRTQVDRKPRTPERLQKALDHFADRFNPQTDEELMHYASLQCYIASANMVNIAQSLGVKSCIVAGFDPQKLDDFVNLGEHFRPVLVIALGYSDELAPAKIRQSKDQVVIYK